MKVGCTVPEKVKVASARAVPRENEAQIRQKPIRKRTRATKSLSLHPSVGATHVCCQTFRGERVGYPRCFVSDAWRYSVMGRSRARKSVGTPNFRKKSRSFARKPDFWDKRLRPEFSPESPPAARPMREPAPRRYTSTIAW